MRRTLALFGLLMLCGLMGTAQNRVLSGKVTDKEGAVIPFASIKIKGTRAGAQADALGAYVISVREGDVLEIAAANFKTADVAVGTSLFITTSLERTGTSSEVIVTSAFGIKRTARSISSNAQVISGDQLTTIRQSNINNALAGKVSGIQVRSQSSAALGAETSIRIRGESNAGGTASNPLYVVDGTVISGSNDINPDDIEDLTVMQGANAGALFGPDGANGAIVITTRKAKKAAAGLGIDINSGIQFEKVSILPDYQDLYAGGNRSSLTPFSYQPGMPDLWKLLDGKFYPDYTADASWGPRMTGQEYIPWYAWYPGTEYSGKTALLNPQPTNSRDFFNTGVTLLNNISFSKVADGAGIRVSYTNLDQKGVIPQSYLKRHNIHINTSVDLNSQLILSANITYLNQKSNAENDNGYYNNSTGILNSWFHRDIEMNKLRELATLATPDGTLASWNHSNPDEGFDQNDPNAFYRGKLWYNPYAYFNNIGFVTQRDRLFGDVSLTYKLNNDFSIRGTYRKQYLTISQDVTVNDILQYSIGQGSVNNSYYYNGVQPAANTGKAYYGTRQSRSNRNTYELVSTYRKKIKDFQLNANAGIESVQISAKSITAGTNGGFKTPGSFTLNNSKNTIDYSDTRQQQSRNAVFARGDIGWQNILFAEFVTRKDWASLLAAGQGLFTSSYGGSFVFSDLTKTALPWLSFGKLRASFASVKRFIDPYQPGTTDAPEIPVWNGNGLIASTSPIPDTTLGGASTTTTEFGIELSFLKNRIGLSLTYYRSIDDKTLISAQVPGSTGILGNYGAVKRRGFDVQINIRPIQAKNFSWDINAAISKLLENTVTSIAPGLDRLAFAGGASFNGINPPVAINATGRQWGMLYGGGAKIINGQRVIETDPSSANYGQYIKGQDPVFYGSVLPSFTGGVQNSFYLFKNFVINVNIDYQVGGKFFSLSDMWGAYSGVLERTAVLNDKGIPIRNAVTDGGGVKTTGVDANGKPVSFYVEAQSYFHGLVQNNIFNDYIYDLSFVKVRELSFGYRIPVNKLKARKFLQRATFSIVARNPWLLYTKTKDFDPAEISGVYGEDGQLPGTRSVGVNLKLGF